MSLYGDYIKERLNKDIVETEAGFCTYFYVQDGVYIEDLYVKPEHRLYNVATALADTVADAAKKKGYKKMYGSVRPSAKGATDSLKVLFAYGMRLDSAGPDAVITVKDI